ncbi:MAG: trehalose-phosphatase [Anaerolineae bacterium]|jgi:trehalose-phosphatase
MPPAPDPLLDRLAGTDRIRLFLDYDGTLADFAPTPEHVEPDPDLAQLVARLASQPRLRVAVISGRRLAHVRKLVPVAGILLAGTYGIEMLTPDGEHLDRLDYDAVRPLLDGIKPRWADLIAGRDGFFLEDKDWSLALHARFAADGEAESVLARARAAAEALIPPDGAFRILGGHKFLEIGPRLAHKGRTLEYLFERDPWPGALPLYLGDDDKDEEAFGVIQAHGGLAIVVSPQPRPTRADYRLESPHDTRRWLRALLARLAP